MILCNSSDEIQLLILQKLFSEGDFITTRGFKTLEISPFQFTLTNPRKRVTTIKARKWLLPLAIGETAWNLSGSKDLEFLSYYLNKWKDYSDDHKTIKGSCYGNKIFNGANQQDSQWEKIIKLLKEDKNTRRAVLSFYDANIGLNAIDKDISCTCTLQFLIRNGKLNAICYMRSNDVIWGLPFDIFFFTFLQEFLATKLDIALGEYHHIVGSMHLYERHFSLAQKMLNSPFNLDSEMLPMSHLEDLDLFLNAEKQIRENIQVEDFNQLVLTMKPYWRNLTENLIGYRQSFINK